MINGIINVYKEKGYTSHDVVAKLRGILKQKKIGHTGTLDPDAQGVLPVCLGNGTKLCDILTDKDKTYEAVLLLGQTTDTQDISGKILSNSQVIVTLKQIEEAILSFIGEYDQMPPMYSAIKINGKRLYELAREGIEVERKTRRVVINHIEILEVDEVKHEIKMVVECSKGTYIRTLCHDIGAKLQCGGCMKSLVRTKVGHFHLDNSLKLSEISDKVMQGDFMDVVTPPEDMFPDYTKVVVAEEYSKFIYNGNSFHISCVAGAGCDKNILDAVHDSALVRVYDWKNSFIGIYQYTKEDEKYKPIKMFL